MRNEQKLQNKKQIIDDLQATSIPIKWLKYNDYSAIIKNIIRNTDILGGVPIICNMYRLVVVSFKI